jgi:predicted nuclease with TOPRIM domain
MPPIIEINPYIIIIISLLPAILVYAAMILRRNNKEDNLKKVETENAHLNATILDLETEIVALRRKIEEISPTADIIRMDDKQKTKIG